MGGDKFPERGHEFRTPGRAKGRWRAGVHRACNGDDFEGRERRLEPVCVELLNGAGAPYGGAGTTSNHARLKILPASGRIFQLPLSSRPCGPASLREHSPLFLCGFAGGFFP